MRTKGITKPTKENIARELTWLQRQKRELINRIAIIDSNMRPLRKLDRKKASFRRR